MAIKILDNETTEKRDTKISAKTSTEEYIDKSDWRIAANSNTGYSHAALVNTLAGKVVANYWLDQVYSKKEGDAHRNGDYHIHDLDNLAAYCFTKDTQIKTVEYGDISIEELLKKNVESFTVKSTDLGEVGSHTPTLEEDMTDEDKVFVYKHVMNKRATNLRKTRENAELVLVSFMDGYSVRCTPDHKFLVVDTDTEEDFTPIVKFVWREAASLSGETNVISVEGVFKSVKNVVKLDYREDVYCMEVEDTHCFALGNGVIAHNCCGHDLQKLLNEGFNGVAGRVGSKAPKHVREALYQMANFIGILQAEWAGAQAFSSFDTYLSPLVFFDMNYGTLNFDELKKAVRNFVFNLNVPSRWGQSPFSNITIDLKCPNDLKDRNPMREHKPFFVSVYEEYKDTIEKVRSAIKEQGVGVMPEGITEKEMEVFMSWEILMQSAIDRLTEFGEYTEDMDDETVCYSLCYKHFDKEMKLITKAYYEVMNEGDAFGLPFTFPIPTINIGEDFDWDNPEYDVIWDNTAKYGSSYFQNFIGSQYLRDENGELTIRDENAYSPNDVRSMCPLTLDTEVLTNNGIKTVKELNPEEDMVYMSSPENRTGELVSFTKTAVYHGHRVLKVVMSDGSEVKMSEHHDQPVWPEHSEKPVKASELKVGDVMMKVAEGKSYFVRIVNIEEVETEPVQCISLITDCEQPYFVLGNGIITSNCRLQLDKRALRKRGGGLFGSDAQTGSIGVVTINLARIGYNFKGDKKGYMKQLYKLMDMAKSTLEKKRAFVTEMVKRGLYPYTRRYVNSALNGFTTYFSTIGVNGMNESIRNFTNDEHDIADEWGRDFALEVMGKIRERLAQYQDETGNLYNLEASPGEGTTYRFAKEDAKRFGDKEVRYIVCEKHGKVEVVVEDGITEIECPLCASEKNND